MKKTNLLLVLFASSMLGGCAAYNLAKGAALMKDYNLLATGDAVFNSNVQQRQFLIPIPYAVNKDRILVCYNDAGIFGSTDEQPLRDAASEWLELNRDFHTVIVDSQDKSGIWDSRVCYEFTYQQAQPIGAYLDEETGEVVIVGEQRLQETVHGS